MMVLACLRFGRLAAQPPVKSASSRSLVWLPTNVLGPYEVSGWCEAVLVPRVIGP